MQITTDERSDGTKKGIIFNGGRLNTVILKRLLVEVVRHKCKMVALSYTSSHRKPTDRQRGTTAVTHVSPLLSASVLASASASALTTVTVQPLSCHRIRIWL